MAVILFLFWCIPHVDKFFCDLAYEMRQDTRQPRSLTSSDPFRVRATPDDFSRN